MVVGVGGAAVGGAEPDHTEPDHTERDSAAEAAVPTRRELTRGLLASAAALALAPVPAASQPATPVGRLGPGAFEETYGGRRIQGVRVPAAGRGRAGSGWEVTVDGRPLHLMRRADGTWLSMVDHYSSYRTPLEATRAAVDEMGPGRRLRDLAPGPVGGAHPEQHMEGQHGVRA